MSPLILSGVLGAIVAWRLPSTWDLPAFLVLAGLTVPLVIADLTERRLPNRLTLPAYPALGVTLSVAAVADGRGWDLARAVLAGAALIVGYGLLHALRPASLGAGDVKLSGALGIALGWISWDTVLNGAIAGYVIGAIVGATLLVRGERGRAFAFGPAMLAGAWLAILSANA